MKIRELIVYACPTGDFGRELDIFFTRSAAEIGQNTAHAYMPHCTLTGFFHDVAEAIPFYVHALETALQKEPVLSRNPIRTTGLCFLPDFHYVGVESHYLESLTRRFRDLAINSPTQADDVRLKTHLHISLAYVFSADEAMPLQQMAQEIVTSQPSSWVLCLYERLPDNKWVLHANWPLPE